MSGPTSQVRGPGPLSPAPAVLGDVEVATNDVLVAATGKTPVGTAGYVKMVWAATFCLAGVVPPGSGVWLSDSTVWNTTGSLPPFPAQF